MLAARASVFVEGLVAVTAIVALGLATSPSRLPAPPPIATIGPPTDVVPLASPLHVLACQVPDQPYRAKHFMAAARAMPSTCGDDIQLLGQLSRAWEIGMDRRNPPTRRFEALAEARNLDLVFGGLYGDEIDATIKGLIVQAAVKYARTGDRDNARLAIDTASLLGVHARELESVSVVLDR